MTKINDFSGYSPTWCPGCGNWSIGIALKTALSQLNFSPSSIFVVFGIGCSGNMNDSLNAYAIHSLHGRAIPNAIGIKIANHQKPVIAVVGDGDCYGEGGNHLIHACRGNHDITVIVHDNNVYGLTTGQVAPTAQKGFKSKSTPFGSAEEPINPLALSLVSGATFVAQSFAGNPNHLVEMIKQAIVHPGFALLNILQPCVSFNKTNTYQYYQQKTYLLSQNYDKSNFTLALQKALELKEEKFPLGIIYQTRKPTFTEELPQLEEKTLLERERFTRWEDLIKDYI